MPEVPFLMALTPELPSEKQGAERRVAGGTLLPQLLCHRSRTITAPPLPAAMASNTSDH